MGESNKILDEFIKSCSQIITEAYDKSTGAFDANEMSLLLYAVRYYIMSKDAKNKKYDPGYDDLLKKLVKIINK